MGSVDDWYWANGQNWTNLCAKATSDRVWMSTFETHGNGLPRGIGKVYSSLSLCRSIFLLL